jgi:hypothetical protein
MASSVRAVLVRKPGPPRRICREEAISSAEGPTVTSLTLVRYITARPEVVFDAITTPEGIADWWGPDSGPVLVAETELRAGHNRS